MRTPVPRSSSAPAGRARAVPGPGHGQPVEPAAGQRRHPAVHLTASRPSCLTEPVNALRLTLHPQGMAPRIANLAEWSQHMLRHLRPPHQPEPPTPRWPRCTTNWPPTRASPGRPGHPTRPARPASPASASCCRWSTGATARLAALPEHHHLVRRRRSMPPCPKSSSSPSTRPTSPPGSPCWAPDPGRPLQTRNRRRPARSQASWNPSPVTTEGR